VGKCIKLLHTVEPVVVREVDFPPRVFDELPVGSGASAREIQERLDCVD